jgi:alpha-D-ribose 1-methylphosphonate 5-triphosphate diphosphatase
MDAVFANAHIVTPEMVVSGSLAIRDGRIAAIDAGATRSAGFIDCDGDYLLPGLIDVHTDNLERHFVPRPGVLWPSALAALLAHDGEMLGAGVTTVLDAVALGDYSEARLRSRLLRLTMEALAAAQNEALLRADHFLHFRCELSDGGMLEFFNLYADHPRARLISVMDHTPGQRQWRDLDLYRAFRRKKNGSVWTDEEFAAYLARRREQQILHVDPSRDRICEAAAARGLPIASHDDTTLDHVASAHGKGVAIAEFPTTREAARHARRLGMKIVMGAPNVVLGGSHSGNVGARELVEEELVDALCSDYVPASLLQAIFVLAARGMAIPAAAALATANPAALLGLDDRGRIALGLRANLLRVRIVAGLPILVGVWRDGEEIAPASARRPYHGA